MTPAAYAAKVEKWAKAGFSFDVVQGARIAMEQDANESRGRAPRKTGKLAQTIKVSNPSAARSAKTGVVSISLVAGSRAKGNPVREASVLQRGLVGWPGKPATRPHAIEARGTGVVVAGGRRSTFSVKQGTGKMLKMVVGGQLIFRRKVQHPGSRFPALNFVRVNEQRLEASIDRALEAGAAREGVA